MEIAALRPLTQLFRWYGALSTTAEEVIQVLHNGSIPIARTDQTLTGDCMIGSRACSQPYWRTWIREYEHLVLTVNRYLLLWFQSLNFLLKRFSSVLTNALSIDGRRELIIILLLMLSGLNRAYYVWEALELPRRVTESYMLRRAVLWG
jgi:hypothetical protein